jgi:DNA-binding CsgD family transcriptional regulator
MTYNRSELIQLLDLIDEALSVDTRDGLESLWHKTAAFVGLEGVLFGVAISDTENDLMKTELITYGISEEWNQNYKERGFIGSDPLIIAALALERPISWKRAIQWLKDHDLYGPDVADFRYLAVSHGMKYGYVVGKRSHVITQTTAVTSVTTGTKPILDKQASILEKLLPHINEVLVRPGIVRVPRLSEREMEVLKWAKVGKSNWEVSVILNISERTVKFHMRNIYRKLEVTNKSHAIAKAMKLGIVSLD